MRELKTRERARMRHLSTTEVEHSLGNDRSPCGNSQATRGVENPALRAPILDAGTLSSYFQGAGPSFLPGLRPRIGAPGGRDVQFQDGLGCGRARRTYARWFEFRAREASSSGVAPRSTLLLPRLATWAVSVHESPTS